jgi:biopolymer transport protein ExbD
MRFTHPKTPEPEINLIPFIDVLLVVLIFLMLCTTYSKVREIDLQLPSASAAPSEDRPVLVNVSISAKGEFYVQGSPTTSADTTTLTQAIDTACTGLLNPVIAISADARTPHQFVVQVLEAAQRSGHQQITFVTLAATPSALSASPLTKTK